VNPNKNKHPRDPRAVTLGQYIRQERERCGLTLRVLARQIGMHYSYISRVESGDYKQPSPEILQRIAHALGVEYSDLFALTGYRIPEDLPDFVPYLRARYRQLPDDAIRKLDDYFARVKTKYRAGPDDPSASRH